jgi:hypothetical protein
MKRYLVVETFRINGVSPSTSTEVVYDTDTLEEAETFIDEQEHPENFEIEDQFEDGGDDDSIADEDFYVDDYDSFLPNPIVPLDRDLEDDEVDLDNEDLYDDDDEDDGEYLHRVLDFVYPIRPFIQLNYT